MYKVSKGHGQKDSMKVTHMTLYHRCILEGESREGPPDHGSGLEILIILAGGKYAMAKTLFTPSICSEPRAPT